MKGQVYSVLLLNKYNDPFTLGNEAHEFTFQEHEINIMLLFCQYPQLQNNKSVSAC